MTDAYSALQKSTQQLNGEAQPSFATYLSSVPVTIERKPYISKPDDALQNLGIARVNIAADEQHPNGTTDDGYAQAHSDRSVLQQHCDYWDTDNDGVIWPQDTYYGCRRFGWNPLLSLLAAYFINLGLSYPTCPGVFPDPFFRIYTARIHKDKHGSSSRTYDNEGRFKPQNFEDIFSKYDRGNKGGLTLGDVWALHKGQRMVFDFFGWFAVFLECKSPVLAWKQANTYRDCNVSSPLARGWNHEERGYSRYLRW